MKPNLEPGLRVQAFEGFNINVFANMILNCNVNEAVEISFMVVDNIRCLLNLMDKTFANIRLIRKIHLIRGIIDNNKKILKINIDVFSGLGCLKK